MSKRLGFVTALACACALGCAAEARAQAQAQAPVTLPLAIHVAELDGAPVVDARFVADRIERANVIYAPYGVAFRVQATSVLAAAHAVIDSRADRDALATELTRGTIDVFVVQSLRDVDEPARMRRGVHWHASTPAGTQASLGGGAHYVILSAIAGLNVLAHELGHYLGNHEHSEVPGNLMSYLAGPALPVLDAAQQQKLARAVRGYLRRHELVPIAKDTVPP